MNTCGNCRHWFKLPADPNNLGQVRGECRAVPPAATTVPINNGQAQLQLVAYPKLAPEFPACALFEKPEEE